MLSNYRKKRIWHHVLNLEKATGVKINKIYPNRTDCPLWKVAPSCDSTGRMFTGILSNGTACYGVLLDEIKHTGIYTIKDSIWWKLLSVDARKEVMDWLGEKIANNNSLTVKWSELKRKEFKRIKNK